jgi:hypothetical protein
MGGQAPPAPRGGRDSLARRLAKQLAARAWPQITPTMVELAALEVAVRHGATGAEHIEVTVRGRKSRRCSPLPVPKETRAALRGLLKRVDAPFWQRHGEIMARFEDDPGAARRVFLEDLPAGALARRLATVLRSDPGYLDGILMTDDQATDALADAGLVPDGHGGWVRRR